MPKAIEAWYLTHSVIFTVAEKDLVIIIIIIIIITDLYSAFRSEDTEALGSIKT